MKHFCAQTVSIISVLTLFLAVMSACGGNNSRNADNGASPQSAFFGDSTLTIISTNRPNGYLMKVFKSKDLTLLNLTRGDSINQYVPIHDINVVSHGIWPDSCGVYYREFDIPVEKQELGSGTFFMDVNFDGEEELLIEHPGYNRTYYACFDIVNGEANVTPGILSPMSEPPYNNIVSTDYPEIMGEIHTDFDYDKKTIHIVEQMGCSAHMETWCEYIAESEWEKPKVTEVRQEYVEYTANGYTTEVYTRKDGKLELTNTIHKKYDE